MKNYRFRKMLTAILILMGTILIGLKQAYSQDVIRLKVSDYDSTFADDAKWQKMNMKSDHFTHYSLTEDDEGDKVIKATAKNAAGGLAYQIDIDPNEYPIIEWRWKVDGVLQKGNLKEKDGDDYAARIYLTFDYDKSNLSLGDRIKYAAVKTFTSFKIPLRALNYVWANKAQKGTVTPNAYTDWVYMVALESGEKKAGKWVIETRNILDDYDEAFGEDIPAITGVAITTDTDNTSGTATAYYGDIIFRKTMNQIP